MYNEAKPIFYSGYFRGRKVLYSGHVGGRYTFLTFEHSELGRNLAPSQI